MELSAQARKNQALYKGLMLDAKRYAAHDDGFEGKAKIYEMLTRLNSKNFLVRHEDFLAYQALKPMPKLSEKLADFLFRPLIETKYLNNFTNFVEAGGRIKDLKRVLDMQGTEKEYLKHIKERTLMQYFANLNTAATLYDKIEVPEQMLLIKPVVEAVSYKAAYAESVQPQAELRVGF